MQNKQYLHTNLLLYCSKKLYLSNNESEAYIILNTSRKHVNYEEDNNKVPMNKPYNIQNTNICNGIYHISFFKALLINEGETTRGEMESGPGANGNRGRNDSRDERDSGRNDPNSLVVYTCCV
jgi:hypothetical protein